jgi:hypothetical protein
MNHEAQKKLADQVELEKLQKKVDRMRQLVPTLGFFKCYFVLLKHCKTDTEAFNLLNDEYFELFGVYRYSDWDAFRNSMKYHNKK